MKKMVRILTTGRNTGGGLIFPGRKVHVTPANQQQCSSRADAVII